MTSPAKRDWKARLQALGSTRYHHRHPFNLLMHGGRLELGDLRLWVANRYYYQTRIPIKDALIVAKSEDPGFRRVWVQRVLDHDGRGDRRPGGLELWMRLGRALGLTPEQLEAQRELLPPVRRACDDYVDLVRRSDLVTSVASSLTECFAGELMQARIDAWQQHYRGVAHEALRYFEERVTRSADDAAYALWFVDQHAITPGQQQRCLDAFERKCDILWRLLSAVYIEGRRERRPKLAARASLVGSLGATGQTGRRSAMLLVPEKALELNPTAAALLERCTGAATLDEIIEALSADHQVDQPTVELDIATFVGELEVRRLLVFDEPTRARPTHRTVRSLR